MTSRPPVNPNIDPQPSAPPLESLPKAESVPSSSKGYDLNLEIKVDSDMVLLFIVTLLTFLVIDITFIYMVTGPMFSKMVPEIQGSPLKLKLFPGFLTYTIMAVSLFYFVIYPNSKSGDLSKLNSSDYMSAFILGLSIFAAFDLTNLAIFENYSPYVAMFDIAWGSTLFVLTTFVTSLVYSNLKN